MVGGSREDFFVSGLWGLGGYFLGSMFRFGCSGSRIISQMNYYPFVTAGGVS